MSLSIWQILLVGLLFILLFGRGKIPALMSDLAAGIKSFKHGIKEQDQEADEHATIANEATPPTKKAAPASTDSVNQPR
ncbi:twin-arginine translocase TatA/TatE family subunit [Paraglaciecola arctica]|uniref:twin-arginine translocase TatA/TatE family subunit n=1 Tax=Paraglaciecola arctica TaxID=1128911 RepID=UPI001C072D38|nr:twin-arginine translocase TatA/TatE family subunit [Paraglaciecola arctica]MBU3002552.1 twin-arginine translocase TatA/TatE family subunit [Paraglaciecola arctica]